MKKIFLFLSIITSQFIFSQNETANWYFGDKIGLNYNLDNLSTINDSKLYAPSSSSSMSDGSGNLILYTNGAFALNSSHNLIQNSINLGSETNKTQSTIIIPNLINNNIYYIFCARETPYEDILDPIDTGLYYNVIDIEKNEVIKKRKKLASTPFFRMTAVQSDDKKNIWIAALGYDEWDQENNIYSKAIFIIKVNKNGIDFNNIKIKKIGNTQINKGSIKFSPNGKKLAYTDINEGVHLFNFDIDNGEITSDTNLPQISPITNFEVFGLEFSSNSNFLYTTSKDNLFSYVHQIDLRKPIVHVEIDKSDKNDRFTALQLSFNGKIYHNNTNDYLSVIDKPYKSGIKSNYLKNKISVTSTFPYFGLPNFITSYFRTNIKTTKGCVNTPLLFNLDSNKTIKQINWDFDDTNTGSGVNSNHTYTSAGSYLVKAFIKFIDNQQIIITKEIDIFPNPDLSPNESLTQCDEDDDGISFFNLTLIENKINNTKEQLSFSYFEKEIDAQNNNNKIENPTEYINKSNPQTIYIRAINENNCHSITNFSIKTNFIKIDQVTPMIVCEDSDGIINNNFGLFNLTLKKKLIIEELSLPQIIDITFYKSLKDAQTKQNKLDELFISDLTKLWIRIDDESIDCNVFLELDLIVQSLPKINLNDTYTICVNPKTHPPVTLSIDNTVDRVIWKDEMNNTISVSKNFSLTKTGNYSVTVFKNENGIECSNSKTFNVTNPNPPKIIELNLNTENQQENNVFISVNGNSQYEFSIDNINYFGLGTSYTFNNVKPGIVTVYVRDINKCEAIVNEDISIIGYSKFLTPNDDTKNDKWFVYGANTNHFKLIDIKIFNRFGKILYTINNDNASLGWNGKYNGKPMPSGEYWFQAKLIDLNDKKIEKKGHFALIRR